jgi:hypothetical protein
LFNQRDSIASHHERCPLSDTFHRFCKWYAISVDPSGFLEHRRKLINADLQRCKYSFEASPFIALSLEELLAGFDCRIVVLVRHPLNVVSSYLAKDWYSHPEVRRNNELPPTFQQSRYFHHFLGRISPVGVEFDVWNKQTRVGKLAWYWTAINNRLLEQVDASENVLMLKLEEFTYSKALEVHEFLQMPGTCKQSHFDALSKAKPNTLNHPHPPNTWTDVEWVEFADAVSPLAGKLGYQITRPEFSIEASNKEVRTFQERRGRIRPIVPKQFLGRLRAAVSVFRHGANSPYVQLPEDIELLERI